MAKAKDKPDVVEVGDQVYREQLKELRAEIRACEAREAEAKDAHKAAKEATATAVNQLLEAIDEDEKAELPMYGDGEEEGEG